MTYGAASRIAATAGPKAIAPVATPTVLVPDVTGQAFVFAKGALEDAGFAWHVVGSVHGYAVNRVVMQDPAPGTKLKDTGAPTITVSLTRTSYAETGEPEDVSPYYGTPVVYADVFRAATPVVPVPATPKAAEKKTPVATKPVAVTPVKPVRSTKRPPAFVVAGAPKEPLKEMPLIDRARLLSTWLSAHPKPTNAAVRHFLYQNAWVVTGARFGWWHGADALRLLIAADRKAQRLWGIGHKSEHAARHALAEVDKRLR